MKNNIFTYYYSREIPIDAQYLYQKALAFVKEGKDAVALRYFQQAVVISPRYSKAFIAMGDCCANLGEYERAVALYLRAAAIDPEMNNDIVTRMSTIHNRSQTTAIPHLQVT